MSTEQESGVPVSLPLAVKIIRELAGSCRYRSFKGFCIDRMSIATPASSLIVLKGKGSSWIPLHSKPFPISTRRYAGVPLKQSAEEHDILIADRLADLLHCAVIIFQHALGGRNPQLL